MSIDKLKRDLISCGKDFFIDNFYEIKRYAEDDISKEDLDSTIKSKDKWSNISTLSNRVSAIKMIIENNQIEDALKITIGSRAKGDVINKAKEIFEEELGRKYDESIDRLDVDINSNLISEIIEELNSKFIQELCSLEEFRFQKGAEKLIEFENYDGLTNEEITLLLNQFKESGLTFTKFVESLDKKSKEYQLLKLLGEVVSYCDLHAANKKVYNQYNDNRTLGKAGVRMNDWLDKLLSYKLANNDLDKLTPSIKNAFFYLKDPEIGLTMLSENHREKFSLKILNKNYDSEKIVIDLISFFEPYDIEITNEKNRTTVYCSILYSKNVKQLWLNDDNIEIDEENPDTKKTNDMKISLNQIFYGPPGTGKTYNIASEAEKIINNKTNSINVSVEFDRITKYIRNQFDDKDHNVINGKSFYRDLKSIFYLMGFILEQDLLGNETLLKEHVDISGTYWPMNYRILTHWGFVDDWKSKSIKLNVAGNKFKNEIINWLNKNENLYIDLTPDFQTTNQTTEEVKTKKKYQFLRTWTTIKNGILPDFVLHKYRDSLIDLPSATFITGWHKTIFCALNMALHGKLYGHNKQDLSRTQEEEDKIQEYFDLNPKTKNRNELRDLEWTGWLTETLKQLDLIEVSREETLYTFFQLTQIGKELVDKIIFKWKQIEPNMFTEHINYNTGVKLGIIEFITFHQSYSYEEFIEGIRPNLDHGNLTYILEPGVFKKISETARRNPDNNHVIIIDEINRGNISKIFGELITLIEPSKRLFTENDEHPKQVTLPYSKKLFGVPKNLYILGTMNTADKSIALLDSALRRRFSFTEMLPNSELVGQTITIDEIDIKLLFETINSRIEFLIDKDHTIGHSYFLKIKDNQTVEGLALIFKNEIIPLLTEYFYGDFEKIRLVLGENKDWKSKSKIEFFNKKSSLQKALFGKDEAVEGYDEKEIFKLNDALLGLNKDGCIKGKSEDLIMLFKSVYTPKSN